jgi:hypothetical protein
MATMKREKAIQLMAWQGRSIPIGGMGLSVHVVSVYGVHRPIRPAPSGHAARINHRVTHAAANTPKV